MSLRFKDITSKYPNIVSQYSGTFFDALDEVNKVYDEFRQIKNNAQGANP